MAEPEVQAQPANPQLTDPVSLAKAVAGLTLQEAANLGEINPAMQRRLGERMDQLFQALVSGAGVRWGPEKDLQIIWPVMENPILKAAKARRAEREAELKGSTAMPLPETVMASDG